MPHLHALLGQVYAETDRIPAAISEYKTGLPADQDGSIHFQLARLYQKMGEKNSDGGQFFTPREVIRAMVHTVDPSLGKKIYDPGCGTGGFLAIAYEHIARKLGRNATSTDIDTLKHDTFFGREKENLVFPIALMIIYSFNRVVGGLQQVSFSWNGFTTQWY